LPPPGHYVKSVRSNETDILADGLTIVGPGMAPLEVMLSGDGSGVRGMVRDKDQRLVAGATVLVVPDQRSRQDLYQQITTDQSGRYEFSSLAPGKHKVFAWDDVAPNAWYDPGFLKDYEKQAEAADLSPKTKANIDLRIGNSAGSAVTNTQSYADWVLVPNGPLARVSMAEEETG